ncbi:glycosyltransferase family 2 protein [candidate division TA06 bacterium]|nr:glycosyltransferase family 2 protein [candidate division TA06 bacterium]
MKLVVITPVGPGHESILPLAALSVLHLEYHEFTEIQHVIVNDTKGELGRSRARNLGMINADWYFFLDADDVMMPYATRFVKGQPVAVFGAVQINGRVPPINKWPCGRDDLFKHGGEGTICMGFFVKAEIAQELRFDETLDRGEDFDFYMRLPSFYKVKLPLVSVNSKIPSAVGPHGYEELDWHKTCREVVDRYKK